MARGLVLASAVAVTIAMAVTIAVAVAPTAARSGGDDRRGGPILEFDAMATVTEPFTGSAHPIRGLSGGGLPWQIDRGRGELGSDGRLEITVRGLVLARRDPVPPAMQGTNPVAQFRGAVNCLTPAAPDTGETVLTDPVATTPEGNARIEARLTLPTPCIAPLVFVTSPANAWFATTGR
jgi:hypothetical protein